MLTLDEANDAFRTEAAAVQRHRREEWFNDGRCVKCAAPVDDNALNCPRCREALRFSAEVHRKNKKANGQCVQCSKFLDRAGARCTACNAAQNARARALRAGVGKGRPRKRPPPLLKEVPEPKLTPQDPRREAEYVGASLWHQCFQGRKPDLSVETALRRRGLL